MSELRVFVDKKQRDRVFGKLLEALKRNEYPYNIAKLPQRLENIPAGIAHGSKEHALFLFATCFYMRCSIKSEAAFRALKQLYERHPALFVPSTFEADESIPVLSEILFGHLNDKTISLVLGYKSGEICRFWPLGFQKLHRFWGGHPANLFAGIADYHEAYRRIMNGKKNTPENPNGFWGFQEKMSSMLAYFLMNAGIIDPFLVPVPVDFHVQRVLFSHEILVADAPLGENLCTRETLELARSTVVEYCREHNESPVRLCDALWLLSTTICNLNPQNETKRTGKYKARKTEIWHPPVVWTDRNTLRDHTRSCLSCPAPCRYNVPSGTYYVRGQLVLLGERTPPHVALFQEDDL